MTRGERRRPRRTVLLGAGTTVDAPKRALDASTAPFSGGVVSDIALAMSERVFQAHVVAGLRERGWTVFVVPDMRKTRRGLPDLICVRPGRMLAWELKSERGRVRPEQREVIDYLSSCPGIDARIVRPSDWPRLRDWIDNGMPEGDS